MHLWKYWIKLEASVSSDDSSQTSFISADTQQLITFWKDDKSVFLATAASY